MRTFILFIVLLGLAGCGPAPTPVFHPAADPERLSEWQLFTLPGSSMKLNEGVVPFDLNTPLFTDYAHKLRTVWLPSGTTATYQPGAELDFPVGTVISKTFYYPVTEDNRELVVRSEDYSQDYAGSGLNLDKVRLIETRLLVHRADGWIALPYVWNEQQTEAFLAITGDVKALTISHDGDTEDFAYIVPDANQCEGCHAPNHTAGGIKPIGPKARHLNKDYSYVGGTHNQLQYWADIGYLAGLPGAGVPRNANAADENDGTLEDRARAYLDINCGHCHNKVGAADTSGLLLDMETSEMRLLGLCKTPVAAGKGSGNRLFSIVPGQPDASIIPFRMESTDPSIMMPELGRSLHHEEGLALIEDWIASLPGQCSQPG